MWFIILSFLIWNLYWCDWMIVVYYSWNFGFLSEINVSIDWGVSYGFD